MKFLKFSIFLLFVISIFSASVTVYLSTIRENEKEKRIYLEGVREELTGNIEKLENDKSNLEREVTDLELQVQGVTARYEEAEQARVRAMNLVRQKDMDIETLRKEIGASQAAFETAQKRNQELERILDELEERLRATVAAASVPVEEPVAYLQVDVSPVGADGSPMVPSVPKFSSAGVAGAVQPVQPQTVVPELPKKSGKFFNLGRQQTKGTSEKKVETEKSQASGAVTAPNRPFGTAAPSGQSPLGQAAPKMPEANQAIAAGQVLLVNRKFNFLVTNLGIRQGLHMDDLLAVERKGVPIAKARVEKLYEDYCAAYITEEQSESPIQEGDFVAAI